MHVVVEKVLVAGHQTCRRGRVIVASEQRVAVARPCGTRRRGQRVGPHLAIGVHEQEPLAACALCAEIPCGSRSAGARRADDARAEASALARSRPETVVHDDQLEIVAGGSPERGETPLECPPPRGTGTITERYGARPCVDQDTTETRRASPADQRLRRTIRRSGGAHVAVRDGMRARGHEARPWEHRAAPPGENSPKYRCSGHGLAAQPLLEAYNPSLRARCDGRLQEFHTVVVHDRCSCAALAASSPTLGNAGPSITS